MVSSARGNQNTHLHFSPCWYLRAQPLDQRNEGACWAWMMSQDWCWSWNSNPLATWWEELTHLKRPWSWERLRAGGEGDDRGWDGWMVLSTRWTWVWAHSRNWWWTGRPGVLWFMGSQSRTRLSDWTELNWLDQKFKVLKLRWFRNYRESQTPKKQIRDKSEDFFSVGVLKASCNFLADKKEDDQLCTKTWHGKEVDCPAGWH